MLGVPPLALLLLACLIAGVLLLLLWPTRRRSQVLVEDAIKHLYHCDYAGTPATLASLSGALGLSGDRAVRLASELEQRALVRASAGVYTLTADGRREALRVIRVHRLWERFLSEETGLDPSKWHAAAEKREHRMTPAEADALSARLGHPLFDPHGDPIPTATGEIPPARGRPLTDINVGEEVEIVHVEDEPHAVYSQILAQQLHLGTRLRLVEREPECLSLEVHGETRVLAPVAAANVWVEPARVDQAAEAGVARLSGLELGQSARVIGLAPACRGSERRRLLDLGIVPGTDVEAEMRSPGGDPTAYRVRGALIALRREQAELIHVEVVEQALSK